MKQIFTRILEWPAWVIGAVIFAQLLCIVVSLGLNAHLVWNRLHAPVINGWALDSTTYYKNLYQQGKINYDLFTYQQAHEARLGKLDKKRRARYRHIDSLSADGLQHELDSLYNTVGQPANTRPAGSARRTVKTNSANRGRGASGPQGPGNPDIPNRLSPIPGYPVDPAKGSNRPAEQPDIDNQPSTAEGQQRRQRVESGSRRLPEEMARSQTGKLDMAGRRRVVYSGQVQINLKYWRLIDRLAYTYPDVAWAISAVETGYWAPRARIMQNHNLFALKINRGTASRRHPWLSLYVRCDASGYAVYDNEWDSMADYKMYEAYVIRKHGLYTQQAYVDHICRRFCPNPVYRGRLDLAFQNLRKIKPLA